MKKAIPMLILAGVAVFLVAGQASAFAKGYKISFKSISFNTSETNKSLWMKLYFNLRLLLTNPANIGGTLSGVKLDFIFNDKVVGSVYRSDTLTIAPKAVSEIPLLVGLSTLSIVPSIAQAIDLIKTRKPLNIKIVGALLTDIGSIPINETVNFGL